MKKYSWEKAFKYMYLLANKNIWQDGQENTIRWTAERLKHQTGVLIADEVGMGKTRVVMTAILSVLKNGGSVAVVVPTGLLSQWEKEWKEFLRSLSTSEELSKYSPILLRSYNSMFDDPNLQFPLAQKNHGKWLLISHRFDVPRLQTGNKRSSPLKKYMLPILAAAIRSKNDHLRRNKFMEYLRETDGWDKNCFEESCGKCDTRTKKSCLTPLQVKRAAEFLSNKRWGKFRNLDDIREPDSAKEFYESPGGVEMIRDLLGPIDLLIIDEAHKSRDTEEDRSQLGNIIHNILDLNGAKRVAITATPMELTSSQWSTIFERIGEKNQFPSKELKDFSTAHDEANKHSDNTEKLYNLIDKSKIFSAVMGPFVTRRRRTKQSKFIELVGERPCKAQAHPHRQWNKISIDFHQTEDNWRPAIFGLEALGKVAKGFSVDKNDAELNKLLRKLKIMDSRYSAGQITKTIDDSAKNDCDARVLEKQKDEFDLLIEKITRYIKKNNNDDPFISGKLKRILYWLKSIQRAGNKELSGHPRIQKMADEIETLVWGEVGEIKEKVLVFGTFIGPLRALRDVLNRRAVLRILARKTSNGKPPPLPSADGCIKDIKGIFSEFKRIQTSFAGNDNRFSKELTQINLLSIMKKAGNVYKNMQAKIESHIDVHKFIPTLPGDAAIEAGRLGKDVVAFLRSRLISDMVLGQNKPISNPKSLKMRALEIWVEFLESFLDTEDGNGKPAKTEWEARDYFQEGTLCLEDVQNWDRFADNMGRKIVGPLESELQEASNRFGSFARMLYGDVEMGTRRILQTQFNNKNSFPMVLIAQSQVGREGLNLHKACRTVLQFHTEWNPGVIEQQIGRVDRIKSFWQEKADAWKTKQKNYTTTSPNEILISEDNLGDKYNGPKIIVMPIVFEGTYDAFQFGVSKKRRETLKAHLFGELLNDKALEKLEKMPKDKEWEEIRKNLIKFAPDFSPPSK